MAGASSFYGSAGRGRRRDARAAFIVAPNASLYFVSSVLRTGGCVTSLSKFPRVAETYWSVTSGSFPLYRRK